MKIIDDMEFKRLSKMTKKCDAHKWAVRKDKPAWQLCEICGINKEYYKEHYA